MFDFIEEPLQASPKDTSASEPVVYTMPQKYYKQVASSAGKRSSPMMLLIIAGVLIIVAGTGVLAWYALQGNKTVSDIAGTGLSVPPLVVEPSPSGAALPTGATPSTPAAPSPAGQENPPSLDTPVPPSAPGSQAVSYVSSIDTDGDQLTDVEERMYSTDPEKPDTDADGFLDGQEVKFLYDPITPSPSKIEVSGLAGTYKNPSFKYSFLYPSSWTVKAVDRTNREVLATSSTGEYISIAGQDNPQKLSAVEWYTTVKAPGTSSASLQTMDYYTWSGVMAENGLEVYLTPKDDKGRTVGESIYVITYHPGSSKELSFVATFQMLIKSFLFTDLSFVK